MPEQDTLLPLVLDFIEWSAERQRSYEEAMDAWRTSCPRLPVWETAVENGYLRRSWRPASGAVIEVCEPGRALLAAHGRPALRAI